MIVNTSNSLPTSNRTTLQVTNSTYLCLTTPEIRTLLNSGRYKDVLISMVDLASVLNIGSESTLAIYHALF